MSSSSPDYSTQYDRYGEPNESNFVGNGSSLFTPDSYRDYEVSVGGKKYIERHWNSGQVHRRNADGSGDWWRIK